MKPGNTGINRIISATGYSYKGIVHSWNNEAAFRQEVMFACIMIPTAFFIGQSAAEISLLILCVFMVLIAEIINSAIEAVVDKVSPELHPLAGAAKDCGSAAVFLALIATLIIWITIITSHFI